MLVAQVLPHRVLRRAQRLARATSAAVVATLAALVSIALVSLLPAPAYAQGLVREVRAGLLYHDVPGLWSGFSVETRAPDINIEVVLSPALPAVWGSIRPVLGASINTGGGTSHAYLDARWEFDLSDRVFVGLGLGVAVHDGETAVVAADKKALGSRVLFHVPFEVGLRLDGQRSVSVFFEHTSNGDTRAVNEALDRIGVRYGHRF